MKTNFYRFKNIFTILLLLLCKQPILAQQNLLKSFVRVSMPVYEPPFPELVKIELPTIYNEAAFDSALRGINFSTIDILAWDLVFTRHPIGVNHNQLNENRLQWFYKRLPIAFEVPKYQTRIVEQTKARTKEAAAKLFHGFAIYYREKPKETNGADELKVIESIVTGKPIIKDEKIAKKNPPKLPSSFNTGKLNKRQTVPFKVDEVSYTYTCLTEPVRRDMAAYYDSIEVVSLNELMDRSMLFSRNTYASCDSIIIGYKFSKAGDPITLLDMKMFDDTATLPKIKTNFIKLRDSTVLSVLNRNKWQNPVICTDVTQSMGPFTSQLLLYLRYQSSIDSQAVYYFFNDGNGKKDFEKRIGSIGGIYSYKGNNFKLIAKTMHTAMRNGHGGDFPENNIECIIKAQKDQPQAKEIIMLADNFASVKDMELLPGVTIPVRIILCGNRRLLHPDYLTIAYNTKGSVHIENIDFADLYKMKEGSILEHNRTRYKLSKGVFTIMPITD